MNERIWGVPAVPEKPYDPGPEHGYQLHEAIWRYATDREDGRRFLDLRWRSLIRSGADDQLLTIEELAELLQLRSFLEDDLVRRLIRGDMIARWLPPGTVDSRAVPSTWWIGSRIASETAEAHGSNGLVLTGLLIRAADAAPSIPATLNVVEAGNPSAKAAEWMRANVTRYKANQRDRVVSQCRVALRIKKDDAMAGWLALDQAIRGTPRTPKV